MLGELLLAGLVVFVIVVALVGLAVWWIWRLLRASLRWPASAHHGGGRLIHGYT